MNAPLDASKRGKPEPDPEAPITGYNHNIPYRGKMYHVQTERLTGDAILLETHVFAEGQVIGHQRRAVDEVLRTQRGPLIKAMQDQHKTMIRQLIAGELTGDATPPPTPRIGRRRSGERPAATRAEVEAAATRRRTTDRLINSAASVGHLDLRRALIRFVRAVDGQRPPADDEIADRLRSILTSIALLTSGRHAAKIRQDDLATLLILRSETLDWLRLGDPAAVTESQRQWRGFADIADAIAPLNHRRTLVEHDLAIWQSSLERLRDAGDPATPLPQDLLLSLKSTWGRDQPLDEALEGLTPRTVGAVEAHLRTAIPPLEELRARQIAREPKPPAADKRPAK